MQHFTSRILFTYFYKAVICLLALSCSSRVNYIESDGALLPVMIKGKTDSKNYLIIIAGGPAGDGIMYHYVFPFFKKLEKEYKIVYYDQRGSGNAKGSPTTSTYNLQQHAIDLNKIVLGIRREDDNAKIYLVGYSYGGSIAMKYLGSREFDGNVSGFIMVSGAFDRKLQSQYQKKLTIEFLEQWVDEGYINSYEYLVTGFVCQPNMDNCRKDSIETVKKVNKRFKKIGKASKYPVNVITIKNLLNYALFAPGSPIRSARNEAQNATYFQAEFDSLSVNNELKISSPILLMTGSLDTNVPYYDSEKLFSQVDTTVQNRELLILEKSGHLPMFTEPDLMTEAVRRFIKAE
jgi:pimeloyl-ACP methyl ester carboxylesterase